VVRGRWLQPIGGRGLTSGGALEGDVRGAGVSRVGRRRGKEGGVEREMFPERVCVLLRV
jgi:hypothetical protein